MAKRLDDHQRARSRRARMIARIHAEARRLGLDDETRRALQRRVTGIVSCAEMDSSQLGYVLDELRRMAGRWVNPDRARLLWRLERESKELGVPWPAYVMGISRQMFGDSAPARIEWHHPEQLRAMLAALLYAKRRVPRHE